MHSSAADDVSADLRRADQLFFFSAFLARFSLRVNWGSRLPLGFAFCSLLAMTNPFTRWYLHSNRTAQPAGFAVGFFKFFDQSCVARSANGRADESHEPVAIAQTLAECVEDRHVSR